MQRCKWYHLPRGTQFTVACKHVSSELSARRYISTSVSVYCQTDVLIPANISEGKFSQNKQMQTLPPPPSHVAQENNRMKQKLLM